MGRASYPTSRVPPQRVRAGDVVLLTRPNVTDPRWLLVDYVTEHVRTPVWSGRWAFGDDAGTQTTQAAVSTRYVVKDARDARRDAERLRALRDGTHV